MYNVCPWPEDAACFTSEWANYSEEVRQRAVALATSTLISLTGRRVGLCPVTIRPCVKNSVCCPPSGPWSDYGTGFSPVNYAGTWFNCPTCVGGCGCTAVCEVKIPGPIGRLDEVKVDGVELNLDLIEIQNDNILVWHGDGCPFPASQDLSLPDSEPGTFSITYQNSYAVDQAGATAMTLLALEFAKACVNANKCKLPRGVSAVVRNGVTFEIESGLFPNGLTGIDFTDAFIRLWVPEGHPGQKASIFTPSSIRRQPRRTGRIGSGS